MKKHPLFQLQDQPWKAPGMREGSGEAELQARARAWRYARKREDQSNREKGSNKTRKESGRSGEERVDEGRVGE